MLNFECVEPGQSVAWYVFGFFFLSISQMAASKHREKISFFWILDGCLFFSFPVFVLMAFLDFLLNLWFCKLCARKTFMLRCFHRIYLYMLCKTINVYLTYFVSVFFSSSLNCDNFSISSKVTYYQLLAHLLDNLTIITIIVGCNVIHLNLMWRNICRIHISFKCF